jgi:hypothetical protein
MLETAIINALIRIIENQITIKEHMGIIKTREKYVDDEYYSDVVAIEDLEYRRENL